MDRLGMFSSPQFGTYSMPSLAEGSEPISEAEEINEVRSLHVRGVRAAKINDFKEAMKNYNEALEIDDKDTSVLHARSLAYLQMGDFTSALNDAETIISIKPQSSQGYLLRGLAYQQMNQFKDAINSLLTALELEPDNADKLTNRIAATVARFCNISKDLAKSLKAMDAYNKLSEVGVVLYQSAHYEMCIQILETAQSFQTNQKGITMRILLTLANAQSKLGNQNQAISLYQECLTLAVATHEQVYQTKSLVNIATLHLESGDTQQAIIYYRKLLCLEAELLEEAGSEETMPDFWTRELQCGLHLNLSIAYKTIGNMSSAIIHAKRYTRLAEKFGLDKRFQAESYHNTGMLNEILGNMSAALDCYENYLQMSKQNSDKRGTAQAYGCLGGVYAGLCTWPTAVMYHQQHIAMATTMGHAKMVAMANEMLGDTYMLKKDYEKAVKQYETVVNACTHNESRTKAMALCKLGRAYRALGRSQYSLYFFEQAITMADDLDFADVRMMADFHQACIQCTSTQLSEIEHAQKAFSKLIPFFEKKISEHDEEKSHCPREYYEQLSQCNDGMLTVLAKMGDKEEALQYAEAHRKRTVTQLPNHHVTCAGVAHFHDVHHEAWTYDRMHRVVSQQSGTVLFYSLLEHALLLWVIQPGVGLVRFYTGRSFKETSMRQQVTSLLTELLTDKDQPDNFTTCESRALPLRGAHLDHLRKQNLKRLEKNNGKKDEGKSEEKVVEKEVSSPSSSPAPRKSPQRQLYEILLSPVEDILMKMEEPRNLVIVPDKELHHCPFSALQDWRGTLIGKRFNLSYIPCLLQLDRVVQNEQAALRRRDDLDFERTQSRKGGLRKLISQALLPGNSNPLMSSPVDNFSPLSPGFDPNQLNLKQVSNPRLLTSGALHTPSKPLSRQALISRETTFRSGGTISPPGAFDKPGVSPLLPHLPDIIENGASGEQVHTVGTPAAPGKVLSSHTYSTVTTRTWTGTDITTSSQVVTTFQQLSDMEKCVVFGVPRLPESVQVHDRPWKPASDLTSAKRELSMVGELLDTDPIVSDAATKQKFLQEIKNAAIIHIATHACLEEGMLLVTPDPNLADKDADDTSHMVTVEDILTSKLQAQLVVISGGFTPVRKSFIANGYRLPAVFLAAGAQSVLMTQWQVPDVAMEKFYFHFYHSLKKEDHISGALSSAVSALREDDRFKAVWIWGAFMLVGHDSQIKLNQIQHAMLDQRIDRAEKELEEETGREILNPKSAIPHVPSKEENYEQLQQFLGKLLRNDHNQPRVIPVLIDMLDAALKRLHTEDNNMVTAQMTMDVSGSLAAIQFLKRLGFHFQARGCHLTSPYVVFPHWNTDDLLIPAYDALRAVADLAGDSECSHALINCLPMSQDNISLMIDLLSITKHATEVQLKVSDLSVKPLWQTSQTRQLLLSVGLHQIGLLLTFNSVPKNKQLLASLLQMLLSVSCHKSPVLLYRLDVSLLGRETDSKPSSLSDSPAKLPSLTPLILPRNQLRMSTPWLSCGEQPDEMMEKMKLARSKSDLADTYHKQLERAKTWHQTSVVAQANEALGEFGRAKTSPSRVKVIPGSSASRKRIPLQRDPILILRDIDQRRDYAHHVLHERLQDIGGRHRDNVMKLFLPYVKS
ncbi:tetratricopeptide repeat protein 28-like [Littorina saxatilis]|uniref:CHAT domain-containing protein n=1 Tax=Littorina saxatilis TaxID=31220 RepID=A0AAN9AWS2_9CAEN